MILNCAIIDEDPEALQLLEQYIEKTPTLHLIGAYKSAIDAVDGIRHNHLDVLFLAIHMQQISGLEFAKVVPKNVKIVFTTAFKEYAIEAYKVNAFDYLLKPISYDDFMRSCQKVFESYMQDDNYNPIKRDGFLVVKRDYKCVRIPIDDILFVDCDKDYIRFHLEGRPNVRTLGNLKQLEERLPKEKFKRVHRSLYAIEAYKVNAFDYLLKPISYDDFMRSCQKVFESYMQDDNYNPIKRDGFLVVKRDYKCVRIPIDDILFVDCDKDYIRFHLEGRPNVRTLGNLKQLEERLPKEKFKRVHRSFLANMTKFDTVDQQHVTYGDQSIPISETYFEFIKKYLEDHSL